MPDPALFFRILDETTARQTGTALWPLRAAICVGMMKFSTRDKEIFLGLLAGTDAASGGIYQTSIQRLLGSGDDVSPFCAASDDPLLTDDHYWPVEKLLNLALMRRAAPTKSSALVTSVRNEGLGLAEWVAYHLAVGIERIFVYWNDNDDGSTALIHALQKAGYITAIESINSGKVAIQRKAIEHSVNLLPELRNYKWVFYLDADEFFISRAAPGHDVPSFLKMVEARDAIEPIDAVMLNWKWFGSENILRRESGLLLDRFLYSKPDRHVKCMVKIKNVLSMNHVHFPVMIHPERIVRADLRRPEDQEHMTGKTEPVYELGQINHYWNKSFEEFLLKKYRGRGDVAGDERARDFSSFFLWGGNAHRGAFDPPPEDAMRRTRDILCTMRETADIRLAMTEVEHCFDKKMANIGADLDIKKIFEDHYAT